MKPYDLPGGQSDSPLKPGLAADISSVKGPSDDPGHLPSDLAPDDLVETVASTPEDVRLALHRVARRLKELGIGGTDRDAIEVVLAECMNNVVEHAYGRRPDSKFELRLCVAGENLFCKVEDHGQPMPGLVPPKGEPHDLAVDLHDLPEGGFGWFLIRELTSDLHYARGEDRNSLSFHIKLGNSD